MKAISVAILLLALSYSANAGHNANAWRNKVIYQVLVDRFAGYNSNSWSSCKDLKSYCGGSFKGLKQKLGYIKNMGFDAVWISPVVENTDLGYHGYWAKDIYKINSYYGTSQELKDLVNEAHKQGVWIMLDVVANHMGYGDISTFYPFDRNEHYHPDCEINNWGNQWEVENCRLAGLPDLKQENNFVKNELKYWVSWIVKEYNFDGIRIDTIPEIPVWFWSEFHTSANVFTIGEAFNGFVDYLKKYVPPLDSVLNYPMYYAFKDVYMYKQSMTRIRDVLNEEYSKFSDVQLLGLFLDNHDVPRFLYFNNDWTLLKNNLAWILLGEGIPIVYYGTEQAYAGGNDPNNRESLFPNFNQNHWMYDYIKTVNDYRKTVINYNGQAYVERYVSNDFFAWSKGNTLVVTSNVGSGGSTSKTISYLPYSVGTSIVNVLDSSEKHTVQSWGIYVTISNGQPKIFKRL
ncbi:Alpha-amylase [Trichoplax sp. H2]|nr:Alpha-amylase [Trichoplax sp. H2]|eukprot:RDD43685.1 Alpha-amylase [Trichoplax sp. H2]